jgi:hypothetical protein
MPVPWLQIVQLVPSILDVSRELLGRTKRLPAPSAQAPATDADTSELAARIATLEDNERRQAELVSQMAEQIVGLTRAVTALHRRVIWLSAATGAASLVAIIAIALASG